MLVVTRGTQKSNVRRAKKIIRILLTTLKKVLDRTKGEGMRITKFHQMLHVIFDMLRFGAAKGYHGGPCESNAKTDAKQPAQNTQKRRSNFDEQVAQRYCNNLVIDIVALDLSEQCKEEDVPVAETGGTRFRMHKISIDDMQFVYKITSSTVGTKIQLSDQLLCYVADTFCHMLPDGTYEKVVCFTEHKRGENVIFRGHPSYHHGGSWNDWAIFEWEVESRIRNENGKYQRVWESKHIHGQIQFFIDLRNINENAHDLEPGLYAVIQSLEDESKPIARSLLLSSGRLMLDEQGDPWYDVASVDTIYAEAFVIPNLGGDEDEVLIATAISEWPAKFMLIKD